jgi:hypothetical protein
MINARMVPEALVLGFRISSHLYLHVVERDCTPERRVCNELPQVRQQLVMEPIGENGAGRESRIGRSSTSGKEWHVNGKLNLLVPHPEEKHGDCAVCSESKGGKWHGPRFICETCANTSTQGKWFQISMQ